MAHFLISSAYPELKAFTGLRSCLGRALRPVLHSAFMSVKRRFVGAAHYLWTLGSTWESLQKLVTSFRVTRTHCGLDVQVSSGIGWHHAVLLRTPTQNKKRFD